MSYYIQVRASDNVITDVIEYPYSDYIPVEWSGPLPVGLYGGWWKYENGKFVEYPELKPKTDTDKFEALEAKVTLMQSALDELLLGGAL